MSVIDSNGRVFGRYNIVDAAAIAFLLVLIPVGYASYLLFRPSRPVIESVTRVDPTREEYRIAGIQLVAKLKVKGSGFNPLLRARIGDTEALGFTFENPNSADVLVGALPPGQHDLVLYDGVQEVARLRGAVDIVQKALPAPWVRAVGWLTNLDMEHARRLEAGFASPEHEPNAFRILAVGPVQPARTRVAFAVDLSVPDRVERPAELMVQCDFPVRGSCTIGGGVVGQIGPVTLANGITFQIDEVGPPAEPRQATVRVQLESPAPRVSTGDRDRLVGARAAEVISVAGGNSPIVTLRLGADESREGWRYRGRLLAPGALFTLQTGEYVASGRVVDLSVADQVAKP
jgi:hypothetical protein